MMTIDPLCGNVIFIQTWNHGRGKWGGRGREIKLLNRYIPGQLCHIFAVWLVYHLPSQPLQEENNKTIHSIKSYIGPLKKSKCKWEQNVQRQGTFITRTLSRGWWGRCEKKLSPEGGKVEKKKAHAARPLGPGLKLGTCRVLGEGPQLHAGGGGGCS